MENHTFAPLHKKSKKTLWVMLTLGLVLGMAGLGVWGYWQAVQANDELHLRQSIIDNLNTENARLKAAAGEQVGEPAPVVGGEMFGELNASYNAILQISVSASSIQQESSAIEQAYKTEYKLPASAEPLKNKEIEVVAVYDEGETTHALVRSAASESKPAGFMPFVKTGDTWKYAE